MFFLILGVRFYRQVSHFGRYAACFLHPRLTADGGVLRGHGDKVEEAAAVARVGGTVGPGRRTAGAG